MIKNRNALELATTIDTIALDKTGTLTEGEFSVTGLDIYDDHYSKEEVLKIIGALEVQSNHPLAEGILNYLKDKNINSYTAQDTEVVSGVGIKGTVEDKKTAVVNQKELNRLQIEVHQEKLEKYTEQGNTISFLLVEQKLVAMIALGDRS